MAQINPGPQKKEEAPIFLGGPEFKKGGWGSGSKNWLKKYGQTVILPLIALLILAGGIYLYQKSRPIEITETEQPITEEGQEMEGIPLEEEVPGEEIVIAPEEKEEEAEGVGGPEITEEPKGIVTGESITEKAAAGEGITHLARRALKDYLNENPEEAGNLTKEHKIFIEDYLKDKKVAERQGNKVINPDEEITFSKDQIKQAIDAANNLTEAQLNHIKTHYSPLVPSL